MNIWNLILLCFLLIIIHYLFFIINILFKKKDTERLIENLYFKLNNNIQNTIRPEIVNITPQTEDIINLATKFWNLKTRIEKIPISEKEKKGIQETTKDIENIFFKKYDVEIIDYTGKEYQQGLGFTILDRIIDKNCTKNIIIETKKPNILFKNKLIKKGIIIIKTNNK